MLPDLFFHNVSLMNPGMVILEYAHAITVTCLLG